MKLKLFKSGAYTTFEKTGVNGYYLVKVHKPNGEIIDKVICDDYADARAYLKCFNGIARNAA